MTKVGQGKVRHIGFRMRDGLVRDLKTLAAQSNVTMQSVVINLIEQWIVDTRRELAAEEAKDDEDAAA